MIEEGAVGPWEDQHVDGVTGVHVTTEEGHFECVELLKRRGPRSSCLTKRRSRRRCSSRNYGEAASALVKARADPVTPYVDDEDESHNLLMDIIIIGTADFALLLIKQGAD
ncbi:LOW QUALITY PROTEIN: hypothetical protein ACHAWF_001521, partial [Thalassiosira exigua]